jgi:hypothetical protein
VPVLRRLSRTHQSLPVRDALTLLTSKWHEERLLALFLLVDHDRRADAAGRQLGAALLSALADTLGSAFTPDVRDVWATAYAIVAAVMRRALTRAERPSLARAGEQIGRS